jgi:hypothetical protein
MSIKSNRRYVIDGYHIADVKRVIGGENLTENS